ncbi:MarR family transcriptional regulator [Spongiactinospora rosea]|uniref:MarR family transcriptional regulator n=1 Tax=Spongiactinospora rosea TaxID=2248750 RepID=A0A366LKZ6_9ACTN|nr:helix-turn-helix domain-containing protein [Spongiactinospora rosea]RBQ14497.1 MarR family transcriptional regulator [Spongiactinospora rosea]
MVMGPDDGAKAGRWTFLTNHARVLLEIARDPEVRLRDVAATAGITERAAQAIVSDLVTAGYLTRTRVGRRNRYTINEDRGFRHPAEADLNLDEFLALFTNRNQPHPTTDAETVTDVPATPAVPTLTTDLGPAPDRSDQPDQEGGRVGG